MDYQELLIVAQDAARMAGNHALSILGHAQIEYKPGHHIVTQADRQCQQIITEIIGQRYPHHGFIGEEGPDGQLFKQPPSHGDSIWWIIDPIDGTRNFAYGVPQFCVSIAAMKGGVPVIGVIYDPNTQMMFSTHTDAQAVCNGSPMRCSDAPLNSETQVGFTSRAPADFSQAIDRLGKRCIAMNLGTIALHLTYVALGAYAAAFIWDISLWDIAAGALIAENAGATLTDFDATPIFPIDCGTYSGQNIPLIVGGPKAHAHLLDTFSRVNDR